MMALMCPNDEKESEMKCMCLIEDIMNVKLYMNHYVYPDNIIILPVFGSLKCSGKLFNFLVVGTVVSSNKVLT